MESKISRVVYDVRFRAEGAWTVQREGAQRPNSIHPNQRRARDAALKLAKNHKPSKVVVHDNDGSVVEELLVDRTPPTKASGR